jgi:Outer membrane protein beta-barrel domain
LSKFTVIAFSCVFFLFGSAAFAQSRFGFVDKGDVAFGFGTIEAPSASSASGDYSPQSMTGGLYPSFSVDFLLHHNLGVSGELSWRASQNLYEGYEPYRPLLYDFGGIWAPRFNKKVGAEVTAGIGAESIRFYSGTYNCNFITCTDYTSSNHLMGHFGAGVKIYVHGNFFVRPEANFYLIRNNVEFSSAYATRVGASLGYTF